MNCSPPGASVLGVFQLRILEWVAMSSSRESSLPRNLTHISCVFGSAGGFSPAEPSGKPPFYTLLLLSCRPVMSDSLQPPCTGAHQASLSPSLGVNPSSCSLHQWCCPAISSSDTLFSFCPRSFPASGIFPISHLFASDDQNTGASVSASVLPVNIQGWSPLKLTSSISLLFNRLSGVFSSTTVQRHNSSVFWLLYSPALTTIHDHWEDHSLDYPDFCWQVMSLLFNIVSRFVIDFYTSRTNWDPNENHTLHLFCVLCVSHSVVLNSLQPQGL